MTKPTALYRLHVPAYCFVPPPPHIQKQSESAQQDSPKMLSDKRTYIFHIHCPLHYEFALLYVHPSRTVYETY